jgi:ferredoxin
MKVWIDQERCVGDGQCAEICPDVFFLHDDGRTYLAHVKEVGGSGDRAAGDREPATSKAIADVPGPFEEAVIEAGFYCPGECIFIERNETSTVSSRRARSPAPR